MGYLFLSVALLAGATKGWCGKRISDRVSTLADSAWVNTARMGFCILIGGLLALITEGPNSLLIGWDTLWMALLGGVCSALFVISWLFAVRQSAYMLVEVFLLAGTLIPVALSRILYGEKITLLQGAGIGLLLVAVFVMSTYNTSVKGKISPGAWLPPILAGVSLGLGDFSQKAFARGGGDSLPTFVLYTYVFAALGLLVFYLCLKPGRGEGKGAASRPLGWAVWVMVGVMALCLYLNSYFKTLAGETISAARLYPLSQGASVVLSLLISSLFFGEKINGRCILGISLAFAAILMINVL